MDWDDEAVTIVEAIPLPPVIAHYSKMDAERRARKKGLGRVSVDIARETERGYEQSLGRETVELLHAMARGEDVQLPEEFFVDEPEELFKIQLCPAQYGASTMEKRMHMLSILVPVRQLLKKLGITQILMDKAESSLMAHHCFRVGITGCTNACFSPYFLDFGILGKYRTAAKAEGCTRCGVCVDYCSARAITLGEQGPEFDRQACMMCAGCTEVCPEGVIYIQEKGYKVVAGGCGARLPHIADTIAECTDGAGVLKILENAVRLLKETPTSGRFISLREVLRTTGVDALKA